MPLALLRHATQKPPIGPLKLDLGNPLSRTLAAFWVCNEFGSTVLNDSSGQNRRMSLVGTPSSIWTPTVAGASLQVTGSVGTPTTYFRGTNGSAWFANGPYTIWMAYIKATDPGFGVYVGFRGSQAVTLVIEGTTRKYFHNDGAVNTYIGATVTENTGEYHTQAGVWNGSQTQCWWDASPCGTAGTGVGNITATTTELNMPGDIGDSGVAGSSILAVGIWNRALAQSELQALHSEPYALFQTRPVQRWFTLPGPVNTPITATDSTALADTAPSNVLLGGQYALERPTADTSAGLWTPSSGGTLFGMLNETTADASTFDSSSSSPAGDTFEVSLGNAPVAIDLNGMPGVLNYQYQGSVTGGRRVDLTVVLLCNSVPVQTWTLPAIQSTFLIAPLQLSSTGLAAIVPGGALSLRTTATQI